MSEDLTIYGSFISRQLAKEKGLKRYFTGVVCKRGHLDIRQTVDGKCLTCSQIQARERYERRKADPALTEKYRERARLRMRQQREENPEKVKEDKKRSLAKRRKDPDFVHWNVKNKDQAQANNRKWTRKMRESGDLQFRLRRTFTERIRNEIKLAGSKKPHTYTKLLGCSLEEARAHIESQWLPGINWDNWTHTGWHIDHIRPCSSFDLTDPEQQKQCFHYTNLQPLWAEDKLRKSFLWDEETEP